MAFTRSQRGKVVGACLVAALGLAACGHSRFRYVQNKADGTFFRIPSSWGVLEVNAGKDSAATNGTPAPWQRAFDASETPSIDNVRSDVPTQISGRATVFYVDAETNDGLSNELVRKVMSGLTDDPLKLAQSNPDSVKIVSFRSIVGKGGLKGSRVVFETTTADGRKVTRDQSSLVDPKMYPNPNGRGTAMFKVYEFDVRCESSCFETNKTQIADVVKSWQVIR